MKKAAIILLAIVTALVVILVGCSSYEEEPTTTTTTTKSYSSGSSYGSSYKSSGYTQKPTYKQDDPYYKNNDYNNDGSLDLEEFQGAVNDYMDDYFGDSGDSGRYGRGSSYDRDVDYAANVFGESPDHVNDVYEALGNAMR